MVAVEEDAIEPVVKVVKKVPIKTEEVGLDIPPPVGTLHSHPRSFYCLNPLWLRLWV